MSDPRPTGTGEPQTLEERAREIIWRVAVWQDDDEDPLGNCTWAYAQEYEGEMGELVPRTIDAAREVHAVYADDLAHLRAEVERLAEHEKANAELVEQVVALTAEKERMAAETECGACGGTPPVSGRPCVCGGSNRASKEAQGLREIAFDEMRRAEAAEARAARLEEALREVGYHDPDVPGGVCWCPRDDAEPEGHDAECLAARRALNPEGGEHGDD